MEEASGSSQPQVLVNANKHEQTKPINIGMDYDSYNAATEGNIEFFKNRQSDLDRLLTPNENTVLHIYIIALKSKSQSTTPIVGSESTTLNAGSKSTTKFVEEILEMCSKLLKKANTKGETPLHMAARYGHDDIVEVLIKYCAKTLDEDLEGGIGPAVKDLLRTMNKKNDTALHEAVRYHHLKVVQLLIETDPDFSYAANDANETPLYIAAERGFEDVVIEILDKCKSPMHGGPLGRTALHAAVIRNHRGTTYIFSWFNLVMSITRRILNKIEGISRIVDNNGWTPLHFAAYFYSSSLAEKLLDKDRDVAYMKDKEGRTALHIAAHEGNSGIVSLIVSKCPDCCELVDNRGWNLLHVAFKGEYPLEETIKIILENSSLSNLLNEENVDGDTPLHFYSNSQQRGENFVNHPLVDKMAFNKENLSAWDIAIANYEKLPEKKQIEIILAMPYRRPRRIIACQFDHIPELSKLEEEREKEEEKKRISMLQKASEAHLVVGALITTVTFAACISMPGGFVGSEEGSSHPGSALLRKNGAFIAFIIADTISMVLSSSAVFIHLLMPFLFNERYYDKELQTYSDEELRDKLLYMAFRLILWAMIAMVLAFVTGTYVVLVPSLGLAIPNCIIGLSFLAILLFVFGKGIDLSFFEILHLLTGKFKGM
ncbi:uncharacterized protein LOC133878502 [Alnus glutinosa]|uniref:uncharacterized protein LOC133878502 n=1 Tax=Alnus glutinosa TaxID=3517 RepID=UPI002D78C009|nr:uncharacterized protein LOC133878502 [Alnus glutinosa]